MRRNAAKSDQRARAHPFSRIDRFVRSARFGRQFAALLHPRANGSSSSRAHGPRRRRGRVAAKRETRSRPIRRLAPRSVSALQRAPRSAHSPRCEPRVRASTSTGDGHRARRISDRLESAVHAARHALEEQPRGSDTTRDDRGLRDREETRRTPAPAERAGALATDADVANRPAVERAGERKHA